MSRSGYTDDGENLELYRASVYRATQGKRGQRMLRDLGAALDAMPIKRLVAGSFRRNDGEVCTLGALGAARGVDMTKLGEYAEQALVDEYGTENVTREAAKMFDVARSLAAEVMYENDEGRYGREETPEERFTRMRAWVANHTRELEEV